VLGGGRRASCGRSGKRAQEHVVAKRQDLEVEGLSNHGSRLKLIAAPVRRRVLGGQSDRQGRLVCEGYPRHGVTHAVCGGISEVPARERGF
jgi:hypothetical protein